MLIWLLAPEYRGIDPLLVAVPGCNLLRCDNPPRLRYTEIAVANSRG